MIPLLYYRELASAQRCSTEVLGPTRTNDSVANTSYGGLELLKRALVIIELEWEFVALDSFD